MAADPLSNPIWLIVPIVGIFGFALFGFFKAAEELFVRSHGENSFLWGGALVVLSVVSLGGYIALFVATVELLNLAKHGVQFQ